MAPSIEQLVKEWLSLDPNSTTRSEIQMLWDQHNEKELLRRLDTRIEFGTAGLRGRMEAGWARMNDLIILQTSKGLAKYALEATSNAKSKGIVIGHDHRHHSEHWAQLTAQVFIDNGFNTYVLEGLVHTPMVPFSVSVLGAACGIMITASHNPKDDNGYKVYWENAVQIISPHDDGISKVIASISKEPAKLSSTSEGWRSSPLYVNRTEELKGRYFDALLSSCPSTSHDVPEVAFVNTSMHGVSDAFVKKAFSLFQFPAYSPVAEQQQPDPEFPTVRFPNPEEKGALDLGLQTADQVNARYVLAQDPDSDRFAAAEKLDSGNWVVFTGDQLGSLFAYKVLEEYRKTGRPLDKLAMVASTVSSKMIGAMAKKEGFTFTECLTGFKFIGNTALDLVLQGFEVPFGYEEAIGFMFGPQIRDKDGVAATVWFVQLVLSLAKEGKTVYGHLQELYKRYGYFQTSNSYIICNDPAITEVVFQRLRQYATSTGALAGYPPAIGKFAVDRVIDLTVGYDSGNPPSYAPSLPLSSGQMIQFRAEDEAGDSLVLTLRTSGTEPKIKYYLEGSGKDPVILKRKLEDAVDSLKSDWIQTMEHGLDS